MHNYILSVYVYLLRTKSIIAMTLVGSSVASLSEIHCANPERELQVCWRAGGWTVGTSSLSASFFKSLS